MLNFPEPPKSAETLSLADTDKPLPERLDPNLRYAYFSTIATGGKSLIKSCKDLHLGRAICYKTLKPEFVDDEIEKQRFLREARVSAMLQHPNTVPTYELGRDSRGNYYFTMKLIYGYTLREILEFRERYDLFQLIDVLTQVCQALEYAHQHRVAHRDIKPENVLVGRFGEVLLLDWGLAKVWEDLEEEGDTVKAKAVDVDSPVDVVSLLDSAAQADHTITSHGQLQGTVSYMSPEQINKDPAIDFRTDMYSIGGVLYEILCGEVPPKGERIDQIVRSTLDDVPAKPSEVGSFGVPVLLEQIAMRCLQKDPNDRFEHMGEVIRLLQEDWFREGMA